MSELTMDSPFLLFESHWLFLLMMLIMELALMLFMLVKGKDGNQLYKHKIYQRKTSYRLKVYFLITISAMLLGMFNFLVVIALFVPALVYLTLKEKQIWKEMELGKALIEGSVVQPGKLVKVNNEKEGTVGVLEPTLMTIETKEKSCVSIPYSEINQIEVFGIERLIKESLVLNFREDPEKAMDLLTKLTEELNEIFKEEISENKELQFKVAGIENTNSGYHGMLYTIQGYAKTEHFDRVSNEVRLELARMAHKNDLKMAETNVFYRTRLNV